MEVFGFDCRIYIVFLVLLVLRVNGFLQKTSEKLFTKKASYSQSPDLACNISKTSHTVRVVKGKSITFRPSRELRARLQRLSRATGHTLSYHIERAMETALPELEKRYAKDLRELEAKGKYRFTQGSQSNRLNDQL